MVDTANTDIIISNSLVSAMDYPPPAPYHHLPIMKMDPIKIMAISIQIGISPNASENTNPTNAPISEAWNDI